MPSIISLGRDMLVGLAALFVVIIMHHAGDEEYRNEVNNHKQTDNQSINFINAVGDCYRARF